MRLSKRFKNRFISHPKWVQWFTAKGFKDGVIATLSNKRFERNMKYQIKTTATFKVLQS